MKKRGQMKLSFGMIFSIILIVIFIAFGFYGIMKFLEIQESVKIAQFTDDLQTDINKMWNSQGTRIVDYQLPQKIKAVCFKDDEYEDENMEFESDKFVGGQKINHLDIEKTLNGKEKICFENIKGKVFFTIEKEYGESLVVIKE